MSNMVIQSHKGKYEVRFTHDFTIDLKAELVPSDILIVDATVAQLHKARIDPLITAHRHCLVTPTEEQKSYQGVEWIIDELIRIGFRKNHRLVAIGGGITQDITAFVASIIYRGVKWIFVPTTLLAQCDSCIGSKTSINFKSFKNQLGGFHPPTLIIEDLSLLSTLPAQEIRSGMGEMLHYFLLSGQNDFSLIQDLYDRAFVERDTLQKLIHRSLTIKQARIEIDEFDAGPRNVFNYGHSFGHAIESYTQYKIPHGIAVSFGIDIANQLSVQKGLLPSAKAVEMRSLLEKNWRPENFLITDIDAFVDLLRKDKKNTDNDIRVILTKGLGQMFITTIAIDQDFRATLHDCFKYYADSSSGLNQHLEQE